MFCRLRDSVKGAVDGAFYRQSTANTFICVIVQSVIVVIIHLNGDSYAGK